MSTDKHTPQGSRVLDMDTYAEQRQHYDTMMNCLYLLIGVSLNVLQGISSTPRLFRM